MPPLGYVARRAGQTAALSIIAMIFFLSAGLLLTLAAFFVLEPVHGAAMALLILGLVHLAVSLLIAGIVFMGRRRYRVMAAATPAAPVYGSAMTGLMAAFFTGLSQGVATAGTRKRGAGHTN
jgi:hypothetical protein